jgi:hypothetical protein
MHKNEFLSSTVQTLTLAKFGLSQTGHGYSQNENFQHKELTSVCTDVFGLHASQNSWHMGTSSKSSILTTLNSLLVTKLLIHKAANNDNRSPKFGKTLYIIPLYLRVRP